MTIKKRDFVEITYTGKIKDTGEVFDTTDEMVAKKNGLGESEQYGPVVTCVGEKLVLPGLDQSLEGKNAGDTYSVMVSPDDAFGPKVPQLIQLVPIKKFTQQNIQPYPGLQLNMDGILGTVKTVSGGRTLVDFNHPLAGQALNFTLKVVKIY